MKRRALLELLAGAAMWPLGASAEQAAPPIIGILDSASRATHEKDLAAFRSGLSAAGFVEGQNVTIDYRFAETHYDQLPGLADDLVERGVAVIVVNNVAAKAAKSATRTIPIVFVTGGDPVRDGLVSSLNRPNGNVTGVSFLSQDTIIAKRMEILRELVPTADTIGYLINPNSPNSEREAHALQDSARQREQQVIVLLASSESDFETVFATLTAKHAAALLVGGDSLFTSKRQVLVALAARHAIPAIYELRDFVTAGGLASYGADQHDCWRQAGVYAGRILKGAKPANLPVQLPTKFELVINRKTAKALGVVVPQTLLVAADEVIE